MTRHLGTGRALVLGLMAALLLTLGLTVAPTPTLPSAHAATPLTVSQAIGQQNGSRQTVRGFVVGQPTATNTVVTSGFPNDYALAIADTAGQTSTSQMLYVQIPSAFRAQWGLRSNPTLMGKQIDVTGLLGAYFSHPGMTSTSAFALASGSGGGTGGSGPYDSTYYASAMGKTGTALRSSLHSIISANVTKLTYTQVWTALQDTDADPNNAGNVIEFYSGRSIAKSLNGGDPDDWNREHVWAQSRGGFDTSPGPGTDLQHLRPEDVTVNSTRGNKDFDLGGSAVSQCADCYSDGDSFEPRDSVQGDVARMLFYMAIRYEGGDGYPNLELSNTIGTSAPYIGKLSVLLAWSDADPVSAAEMTRNDKIYNTWQHNRNPFIDHPEWAHAIWG